MARAKRTHRADARRRYREAMAAQAEGEEAAAEVPTAAVSQRPTKRSSAAEPVAARPSFFGTFRAAVQPADVRGDLAYLPRLIVSPAILAPIAIVVASTVVALLPGATENVLVVFAVQLFLQPPALAIAFIGGWLAKRGSWLVGGIAGAASVIGYAVVIVQLGAEGALTPSGSLAVTVAIALAFGFAVGAFAGFYKRWLALMQPSRQQRGKTTSKSSSRTRAR